MSTGEKSWTETLTVGLALGIEAVGVYERVFRKFQSEREQTEDGEEHIEVVLLRERADLGQNRL